MFHQFRQQQREVRDADYKLIKDAFDLADEEKNGYLTKDDFKIAHLAIFGCKPSKHEAQEIVTKYGKLITKRMHLETVIEEIRVIDFENFLQVMLDRLKYTDMDEDIRETFHILDARCKGFVDFEDFKSLVHKFLPRFDLLKVRRLFNEADHDSDGRVSFRDFQMLMSNNLYDKV